MHKRRFILTLAVLVCFLTQLAISDCPMSSLLRQTMSGSIMANLKTRETYDNKTYLFDYSLAEEIRDISNIKIAIAISGFDVEKINQQFGFKINMMEPYGNYFGIGFRVEIAHGEVKERWKSIGWNFFISDADQIFVGSKQVANFIPTSNIDEFQVSQTLQLPSIFQSYKPTVKLFLSGFTFIQKDRQKPVDQKRPILPNTLPLVTQRQSIGSQSTPKFQIQGPTISTSSGQLSFTISTNMLQIKAFYYSYVIYVEKNIKDVIYATLGQEWVTKGPRTENLDGLKNAGARIFGLSAYCFGEGKKDKLAIEIKNGKKQGKQFISMDRVQINVQLVVQYFGLQLLSGAICKTCSGSPFAFKQFCVSECPPGFITIINTSGTFECQQCSMQKFLVSGQQRRSCRCSDGYFLSQTSQSCQKCPYDCVTCTLNRCLTCDTPTQSSYRTLNQKTGRCQCQSMNNQGIGLYDNQKGEERRCALCHQKCKTCKGPSISDCLTCPARKIIQNGFCKCGENFVQDQKGQCLCLSPNQVTNDGLCILKQTLCSQTQTLALKNDQLTCTCKPGYTRSPSSNRCLKDCFSEQTLNPVSQKCECKPGQLRHPTTNLCYSCESKLNQYYNTQLNKCSCVQGYQMNKNNQCVLCASKMYYNTQTDECQCIFNYYRSGNQCVKCVNEEDNLAQQCQKAAKLG